MLPLESAMAPKLPQEIWDNITQNISSLNPLKLASLLNFRLDPKLQDHAQVWSLIFKSDKWLIEAERYHCNPVLIGYDLEYCYHTFATRRTKYLVLYPGDISGDFTCFNPKMRRLFFTCLQSHIFNVDTGLLNLNSGLGVYVGAVFNSPEILTLPYLIGIFAPRNRNAQSNPPESRYLFWRHTKNALGRLDYRQIRSIGGEAKELDQVQKICYLILSESCIQTDYAPEYYFQKNGFDASSLECIGKGGRDG